MRCHPWGDTDNNQLELTVCVLSMRVSVSSVKKGLALYEPMLIPYGMPTRQHGRDTNPQDQLETSGSPWFWIASLKDAVWKSESNRKAQARWGWWECSLSCRYCNRQINGRLRAGQTVHHCWAISGYCVLIKYNVSYSVFPYRSLTVFVKMIIIIDIFLIP